MKGKKGEAVDIESGKGRSAGARDSSRMRDRISKAARAEKLLKDHWISEDRVRTVIDFESEVILYDEPILVVYRGNNFYKKESKSGVNLEMMLKKRVIDAEGRFKVCVLDPELA